MGYEVAATAYSRGADVTLVTGPTNLAPPFGVTTVSVETTDDLQIALEEHLADADLLVMAAAPADFRPVEYLPSKRPRAEGPLEVSLSPTPDVLEVTQKLRKPGAVMIGFALETENGLERARAKLDRKQLDLIVLNMANEAGSGFETDTNKVTLISCSGEVALPLLSKRDAAEKLLDAAEQLF